MTRLLLPLLLILAGALPAHAWGKTGHRVTAAVAQTYLSQTADSAVKDILSLCYDPEGHDVFRRDATARRRCDHGPGEIPHHRAGP